MIMETQPADRQGDIYIKGTYETYIGAFSPLAIFPSNWQFPVSLVSPLNLL